MSEGMNKTATDLIVQAMEHADDMEEVIVVYRIKRPSDSGEVDIGFGWLSNTENTTLRVGMLNQAAFGMLTKAYSEDYGQG